MSTASTPPKADPPNHDSNVDPTAIPFRRSKTSEAAPKNSNKNDKFNEYLTARNASSFDDRAQSKLQSLSHAKLQARDAQTAFLNYLSWSHGLEKSALSEPNKEMVKLHREWKDAERELARAYSQGIKYTARIPKSQEATWMAERLLNEWKNRFMGSYLEQEGQNNDDSIEGDKKKVGGTKTSVVDLEEKEGSCRNGELSKKRTVRTIHQIMSRLTPSAAGTKIIEQEKSTNAKSSNESTATLSATAALYPSAKLPKIRIPPPTNKDYTSLLRSYSVSKARRKGQQAETLMGTMLDVAKMLSYYYNMDHPKWTEDRLFDVGMEVVEENGVVDYCDSTNEIEGQNEHKQWMTWVKESIPNSKAFSLAVKCHAGTTHNESLSRIIALNHIHNDFAQCCPPTVPEIYKDDPFVLLHSIKGLKNFQIPEEKARGEEWIRRLHRFVINSSNKDYLRSGEEVGNALYDNVDGAEEALNEQVGSYSSSTTTRINAVDVTAAYTTLIRLYAKLRGTKEVATNARKTLDRMHFVHDVMMFGYEENRASAKKETSDGNGTTTSSGVIVSPEHIARIEIRPNAYNLVLGLYRDSRNAEDAMKAVELLQSMVNVGKKSPEQCRGTPLPTTQSFEYTILALASMKDAEQAIAEANRLVRLMEAQEYLEPSVTVYNALIELCCKTMFITPELFDKAINILETLKEKSISHPQLTPNAETLSLVIKACSLSEREDHEHVLKTATDLFSQLVAKETDEKSAVALTDSCYFHLMKCVSMHMEENEEDKKERMLELFSEACQRGLASAGVLTLFRNSVSEEEYRLTVGEGRLADGWVKNVTGPKALYTDGTKGGAGKNARREGKSTSDWAKKQRERDIRHVALKEAKKARKLYKKIKS